MSEVRESWATSLALAIFVIHIDQFYSHESHHKTIASFPHCGQANGRFGVIDLLQIPCGILHILESIGSYLPGNLDLLMHISVCDLNCTSNGNPNASTGYPGVPAQHFVYFVIEQS